MQTIDKDLIPEILYSSSEDDDVDHITVKNEPKYKPKSKYKSKSKSKSKKSPVKTENEKRLEEQKLKEKQYKCKNIEIFVNTISSIMTRYRNIENQAMRNMMLIDKIYLILDVVIGFLQSADDITSELQQKINALVTDVKADLNSLSAWMTNNPNNNLNINQNNTNQNTNKNIKNTNKNIKNSDKNIKNTNGYISDSYDDLILTGEYPVLEI